MNSGGRFKASTSYMATTVPLAALEYGGEGIKWITVKLAAETRSI